MSSRLRAASAFRLPRGGVVALCGLILALPAGLAASHSLRYDSQGRWLHQHTTTYPTCVAITGDSQLRDRAHEARVDWHALAAQTGVSVPLQTECHPTGAARARLELRDGRYGNVGWRASAWDASTNEHPAGYHNDHTHLQFNLDALGGSNVTGYVKRTLACRTIGAGLGLDIASGTEGSNNDCMSFQGSITNERSKQDYPSNYTYSNVPGPHSISTLAQAYRDHAIDLVVEGPLIDAATAELTDDNYDLWIEASAPGGMSSLEVLVDGNRAGFVAEPCSVGDEQCAEDMVFEFASATYGGGSHTIEVVARSALGGTARFSKQVSVGLIATEDEVLTETPAPQEGSGAGCHVLGLGTQEEGTQLVVNGYWSSGTETTEYLTSRSYVIHRCAPDGALLKSQAVETVTLSNGAELATVESETVPTGEVEPAPNGTARVYHTLSGATVDPETTSAADWTSPIAPIPPTPTQTPIPEATASSLAASGGACTQDVFRLAVSQGYQFNPRYYIRTSTLPSGSKSKRRIINGHAVWNQTKDGCGRPDKTDFRMIYGGPVGDAHTAGDQHDRVDAVDFGAITNEADWGNCVKPATIACTSIRSARGGGLAGTIIESDIRFESNPNGTEWWSRLGPPPSNRPDLMAAAAHESGHKLGLAHTNDERHPKRGDAQTMFSVISYSQRTLGRGDVRGLSRLYRGFQPSSDPRPSP